MIQPHDHISVCICTYRRPLLLKNLLARLARQRTEGRFTYSIDVIDNDGSESARRIVEDFESESGVAVRYDTEKERGFSHIRNRAVRNAEGNFIAFIDDDEYPAEDWLYRLYDLCLSTRADGILGPIIPHFESDPPQWIVRGRLCDRKTFNTGTVIEKSSDTRTGNVLLNRALFENDSQPFDPRFGSMGGEDVNFFKRMMESGKIFVWCNEAPVWEAVPRERMERSYFLKRALLRGYLESKDVRLFSSSVMRSAIAVILYTMALPVCLLRGQHEFMKYLIKNCDHLGKLLGVCGITLFTERSF